MAEIAASFLFDQLTFLIQQEGKLLGGIGDNAQHVRDELEQMMAFLRAVDNKEESDPLLKEWIEKVREITYDTEDVLERYMLRFAYPRRDSNGFNQYIRKMRAWAENLIVRHQVASEFQQIKLRLENISKSQQRFKDIYDIKDEGSSDKTYGTRGDALLLEETDVVGIEEPKKQIKEWLMQNDDGLKVISVVGMGGLGKTTLVKKIYDDASVKADFDSHVWVLVSENFNLEKCLQRMIQNLSDEVMLPRPQNLEEMTVDDMKDYVYKFLKDKTYIIVLDDVWKIDSWESIRYIFPRNYARCRIIITTRFSNIGNAACSETNGNLYHLNPLTAEESKELFNRKAFQGNSCPSYLSEISKSILKRCEGLPLAIVVIGSLLATKNNNLEDWKMFELTIGLEFQGDSTLKKLNRIMSLSYCDLPYYLKACFLYLSIFHNDAYLEKWRIIRLWMAEGFVEAKEGKTDEEVAESYLNELHSRNLIQVADTCEDGRAKMYRIHDILREYVVSKSKELNFLPLVYGEEKKSSSKIRRMAINSELDDTKECYEVMYLRSLFWSESAGSKSELIFLKVMGGRCRLLKVLDIRGALIDSIPAEVFKLYNLKYLSLRNTNIKLIPKSIINLRNLETLDLKATKVTELPVEILQLRKLRHLLVYSYTGDIYTFQVVRQSLKAPYGIGCLTSLQKLACIDADKANGIQIVREIGKLTQLRRLCITKLTTEDGRDLCTSLLKLTNLRSLKIHSIAVYEVMDLDYSLSPSTFPFLRTVVLRGRLEKFPRWLCSLHGLTRLYLSWSRLRDDPLQHIGGLPNLVFLSLLSDSYEGQELTFRDENFQKLQILVLRKLRGLRCVRVEKGSMPNLNQLFMAYCYQVEELPEGVEHLSNLQHVVFGSMSKKFCGIYDEQKYREGNEWKLAHVPKVWVLDLDDDEHDSIVARLRFVKAFFCSVRPITPHE